MLLEILITTNRLHKKLKYTISLLKMFYHNRKKNFQITLKSEPQPVKKFPLKRLFNNTQVHQEMSVSFGIIKKIHEIFKMETA